MDNQSKFLIFFSIITTTYLILLITREIYLKKQWKKLLNDTEIIVNQHLSGHELVFELEYLMLEEQRLRQLETKIFPYFNKSVKVNKKGVI